MQNYFLAGLIFIIPLLFSSLTLNIFIIPKLTVLIIAICIVILTWTIKLLISQTLPTSTSHLRFGLLAFTLVIILNLITYSSGRLEAIIGPASIYIALSVWAYLLSMSPSQSLRRLVVYAIVASTTILAIHSLAQLTFLYRLSSLPTYMQTRSFTPTGSPPTTFILLLISSILSLYSTVTHPKSKIVFLFSTVVHLISLISLGFLMFPGQELAPTILPFRASWNIALDAMKSLKTLFLGIGLVNFPIFYKEVKPLFLNTTPFWNIVPVSSGSEILQIMTTTGLLGLLSFISLPILALKSISSTSNDFSLKILLIVSGLALFLTPSTITLLFVFFTALGLSSAAAHVTHKLAPTISYAVGTILAVLVGFIIFQTYHVIVAEANMQIAKSALKNNDGKSVYDHNLTAIRHLPTMTSYHLSFSQVNLSLAGALTQKPSLSDSETNQVSQLISQSIQEGKLAISLRPDDSSNWQNLALIYRNLSNVATSSAELATQSYLEAIARDPGNPALRVEFGNLLFELKDYARAQNEFQTSINLKPDYVNAYYNLAKTYENTQNYQNAYLTLQKIMSLLPLDTPDSARIKAELEIVKAKIPPAN